MKCAANSSRPVPELQFNSLGSHYTMMAMNAPVIYFSCIAYGVHKMIILRKSSLRDNKNPKFPKASSILRKGDALVSGRKLKHFVITI